MATWIGLFRGVNVGGNTILPMAQLRAELESLKLKNVRTYIQSGNVVFDAPAKSASTLTNMIRSEIESNHGFRPQLLLLKPEALQSAIDANPYPKATSDPKSLHFFFFFLAERPTSPNIEALNKAKTATEHFEIKDQVLYLYAPDGVGRSKLAANAEKYLGVVTTARNYRTVEKLMAMAKSDEPK